MEMLLVNSCVKKFYKRHENLINKRSELANAFKCGIITGQEECAVVIKTMVLAEGKRLESENEAIHREMSLAKSLGGKVSSNNKTDGATTTSLYAAIAMLPTTGPSSGDRSTSWMRKLTKERKSKLSTKNETVPDESSASSTENVKERREKDAIRRV
jgi:K+-sensing histidine kinase KdpD